MSASTAAHMAQHVETESPRPPSPAPPPPTRHDIDAFMVKYTAHLSYPVVDAEADGDGPPRPSPRLLAPHLYTGADYALVLAACFPARCIDLATLNWSSSPLLSQRLGNLRVFCAAARSLALPDAPLSALRPELLQCNPACIVAHMKVQHWLYSLSLRFIPPAAHDAAALRAVHRHLQLGEPYLKRGRTEQGEAMGLLSCPAVQECAPLSAAVLQRCCGAVLAPVPPFTVSAAAAAATAAASACEHGEAKHGGASAGVGKENHRGPFAVPSAGTSGPIERDGVEASRSAARQKPWLNYSKPWLLPSLKAAEARKAAGEAAAAKRAQEERERNPRYTAFAAQSRDVQQQYVLSKAAVAESRDQLRAVKALLVESITQGQAVDFKEVAGRLRERC